MCRRNVAIEIAVRTGETARIIDCQSSGSSLRQVVCERAVRQGGTGNFTPRPCTPNCTSSGGHSVVCERAVVANQIFSVVDCTSVSGRKVVCERAARTGEFAVRRVRREATIIDCSSLESRIVVIEIAVRTGETALIVDCTSDVCGSVLDSDAAENQRATWVDFEYVRILISV